MEDLATGARQVAPLLELLSEGGGVLFAEEREKVQPERSPAQKTSYIVSTARAKTPVLREDITTTRDCAEDKAVQW